MKIAIDLKNQVLFGGGIAHWVGELLPAWFTARPSDEFIQIVPRGEGLRQVTIGGGRTIEVSWPIWLPRPLRHPYYDNALFPATVYSLRPSVVFSPYHDVRLPQSIPSMMTIHDLCIEELKEAYPFKIRAYYQAMLRLNLKRAHFLLTVSETTRERIIERYRWPEDRIAVIYNTLSESFAEGDATLEACAKWRQALAVDAPLLLYTSGIEYRKNIPRLLAALDHLHALGQEPPVLLVTGAQSKLWQGVLDSTTERVRSRVRFLGYLSLAELRLAYASVDAVVFPSLGEGFGRACLESMACGVPIACSDIPVLHEVAGDYPVYFDPRNIEAIADGIARALVIGRRQAVFDPRFERRAVQASFVGLINEVFPNRG